MKTKCKHCGWEWDHFSSYNYGRWDLALEDRMSKLKCVACEGEQ